jgi:hypothetical protein
MSTNEQVPETWSVPTTVASSTNPETRRHDDMSTERIYRIVRMYRDDRKPRTIKQRLTLEEAQAHCKRDDTHGDGWFDGYDYMKGLAPKEK